MPRGIALLLAVVSLSMASESVQATTFIALPVNPAGANETEPWGISGNTMVGNYFGPGSWPPQGFSYNGTTYTTLNVPSATQGTFPLGIDGTNIVGYYRSSGAFTHGYLYNGSTYTTLDDPLDTTGSNAATGISGANIVGNFSNASGDHS